MEQSPAGKRHRQDDAISTLMVSGTPSRVFASGGEFSRTPMKGERAMNSIQSVPASFAVLVLLAFGAPAPAYSQTKDVSMMEHGGGHGQMMGLGPMDRMGDMTAMCIDHADKMGLTDDQIMKIKPAHNRMLKKQAQFRADLTIAEIEFMEIMEVKDFDKDKASSAVKKIADIKTSHQLEMLKDMKEIRANLTDEQFKKMKKMMPMEMGKKKRQIRR